MHERSSLGRRIEEIILVCLVLLNIFAFLDLLPGDADYIKYIVSLVGIAYLLYGVSPTNIFFGQRNKLLDISIIASYCMLFVKDFVEYAAVAIEKTRYLADFYGLILANAVVIERFSFYAGGIIIIFLSLYFSFRYEIKKPSLMQVIQKDISRPKTIGKLIRRFLIVFIVLVGFFIIAFNLIAEWLAIVLDAPLAVFGLFFYFFIIVGRVEKFRAESLIYKLGKVGEGFYEKFIRAFHSRQNLFLAISGLLVLHLLTDVGIFIIPYLVGVHDILYFERILLLEKALTHQSVYILLQQDLSLVVSLIDKISIVWIYLFNVIATLFLFITPAFIWYNVYKKRGFNVPHIILSLFFISVFCFLVSPVFEIRPVSATGLVGVDIQTGNILPEKIGLGVIFLSSLIIGAFVYIISYMGWCKSKLVALAIALAQLFLGYYIYYFFIDSYKYYINAIVLLYDKSQYFLSVYFGIFLAIILTFYAVSYIIFLSETVKEYKRIG